MTRRAEADARAGSQDDEDTPTVTFPDDYPNSVRHFLLIGFLGMFIGAIVFFYMGISRKVNTVMHVLTFFIAAVSACAYYAEWAGLGVEYKTTDTTPRVIFWAHYLDWVVTGPVSLPLLGVTCACRVLRDVQVCGGGVVGRRRRGLVRVTGGMGGRGREERWLGGLGSGGWKTECVRAHRERGEEGTLDGSGHVRLGM